jgi:hypothetical protein
MNHSRRLNKKIKKSKIQRGGKNLFNIDESSLTNEQKFINSLNTKLLQYNTLSVIDLALGKYDEENVLHVVEDINKNSQIEQWFQSVFDSIFRCFRIFNLKHFLTDYIYNELLKKRESMKHLELEKTKPLITIDELNEFITKFTELNGPLDKQALIINLIKLYLQNKECMAHGGGKRVQNGGNWVVILIIGLILFFSHSSNGKLEEPQKRVPRVKTSAKDDEEEKPSLSSLFSTATDTYMAVQAAKHFRGEDNAWDQGWTHFGPGPN